MLGFAAQDDGLLVQFCASGVSFDKDDCYGGFFDAGCDSDEDPVGLAFVRAGAGVAVSQKES